VAGWHGGSRAISSSSDPARCISSFSNQGQCSRCQTSESLNTQFGEIGSLVGWSSPRRTHLEEFDWNAAPRALPRRFESCQPGSDDMHRLNLSPDVYYRCATKDRILMARIALIEPENASQKYKEIYDGKLKGKPGSIQKALAPSPSDTWKLS